MSVSPPPAVRTLATETSRELRTEVDLLEARLADLDDRLEQREEKLTATAEWAEFLGTEARAYRERAELLERENESLRERVETLEERTETVREENEALRAENDELATRCAALEGGPLTRLVRGLGL